MARALESKTSLVNTVRLDLFKTKLNNQTNQFQAFLKNGTFRTFKRAVIVEPSHLLLRQLSILKLQIVLLPHWLDGRPSSSL